MTTKTESTGQWSRLAGALMLWVLAGSMALATPPKGSADGGGLARGSGAPLTMVGGGGGLAHSGNIQDRMDGLRAPSAGSGRDSSYGSGFERLIGHGQGLALAGSSRGISFHSFAADPINSNENDIHAPGLPGAGSGEGQAEGMTSSGSPSSTVHETPQAAVVVSHLFAVSPDGTGGAAVRVGMTFRFR